MIKNRAVRLMITTELIDVIRHKKSKTTKRDEDQRPATDLAGRQFRACGPNQLWITDITHVPTRTQPIYVATILDI